MKITTRHIETFREKILACNASEVEKFLNDSHEFQFLNSKTLLQFHDSLLLLEAYPPSAALYERANYSLRNFHTYTKRFIRSNKKGVESLVNSGLKGTEIHGAFTYPTLFALRQYFPAFLFLHSVDEKGHSIVKSLKHFLPAIEFEAMGSEQDEDEVLQTLFGNGDHLVHILDAMQSPGIKAELRDEMFSDMGIYSGIILDGTVPDRSTARGIVAKVFAHDQIQKKNDPVEIISKALPQPKKLSTEAEKSLIINSLSMLATLNRETDPISLCAPGGVTLFQLERGISIALFSMQPDRRMPLESYIGYMQFKNGVPVAYGGAWIFGNRALFGINIFEPFRGGESSLSILQLLRVYHQHFGVTAFSVEPYQFGKDNEEGIASGAYWFYYKLGFRSDDKQLDRLAKREMEKMKSGNYRSPRKVLLQFTESRMTWRINPNVQITPDPSALSKHVTDFIRKYYFGNRQLAVQAIRKKIGADADEIPDDYVLAYLHYRGNRILPLMLPEHVKELWESKMTDERHYNAILASLLAVNQ